MIKLLIADDEQIIRDTISTSIEWGKYGIKLIGTASNGLEAYNIILDEYPDIVLTDIRMPGLSGLELIERIKKINHDTEFIILSGYDDFTYAQEAMKFGVKQYLLKPSNELQIIEAIQLTIKDVIARRVSSKANTMDRNIIWTLMNYMLSFENLPDEGKEVAEIYRPYESFIDFYSEPYELYYQFYVEPTKYQEIALKIQTIFQVARPGCMLIYIYVHNTLIIFFKSFGDSLSTMEAEMEQLKVNHKYHEFQFSRKSFRNLMSLLNEIIRKIRRYDTIHYSIDGTMFIPICNYQNILFEFSKSLDKLKSSEPCSMSKELAFYRKILEPVSDKDLLLQIASYSFMQLILHYSPSNVMLVTDELVRLNKQKNIDEIQREIMDFIERTISNYVLESHELSVSNQIKIRVSENLENPDLSLKWIAENFMYMNVDYLSRRFLVETGEKFSKYLIRQRIERSKLLFHEYKSEDKIRIVTELVGCGNNPQYFNLIFKRETGMTPINYIKSIQGEINDN